MKLTEVKKALVDFDGTLLHSDFCWLEAYYIACEKKSILPLQNVIDAYNTTFYQYQALVLEHLKISENQLLEYVKEAYIKRKPKNSVLSIVKSLPSDCEKIIITMEPKELVLYWLKYNNIELFSDVITVFDERDNPKYYNEQGLLLIDDNYKHCVAAKNGGAMVIGVNDCHNEKNVEIMTKNCDLYINDDSSDYNAIFADDYDALMSWCEIFPEISKYIIKLTVNENELIELSKEGYKIIVADTDLYDKLNKIAKNVMMIADYIDLLLANSKIFASKLRVDFSTLCQLNCKTCYMRLSNNGTMGYGYLKIDNFKSLIDENPFIREIETSNSGELFLNPDLVKIMEYAYKKNVALTAYNGVNMNTVTDTQLEAMVKYQFKGIVVSIDGASEDTYSVYRQNGSFSTVMENLKKLIQYKEKYNSKYPIIRWQYIIMAHNELEIPLAKKIAKELNIPIEFKLTWDKDYVPKNIELLKNETGLNSFTREGKQPYYGHIKCIQMLLSPQINWDGRLLGCCSIYKEDYSVNVFEVGLKNALSSYYFVNAKRYLLNQSIDLQATFPCLNCRTNKKMKLNNIRLQPIKTMYGENKKPSAIDYIPYS